jgi:hypothetical protein
MNVLFLHTLTIGANELNANFWFIGKENKHLVSGIVVVMDEDNQIRSCWTFFTKKFLIFLTVCWIYQILI